MQETPPRRVASLIFVTGPLDRSLAPLKYVAGVCALGHLQAFAGWLIPFQGRSLAIARAGPAVFNAGWDGPSQRYITGAIGIAIGLPFGSSIFLNELRGWRLFGFSH